MAWFPQVSRNPRWPQPSHSSALSPHSSKVAKKIGLRSIPAVEIEAGRWVVIRMEDSAVKVVDLTPDGMSYSVDDWLLGV